MTGTVNGQTTLLLESFRGFSWFLEHELHRLLPWVVKPIREKDISQTLFFPLQFVSELLGFTLLDVSFGLPEPNMGMLDLKQRNASVKVYA